jgi:hypothetical protein
VSLVPAGADVTGVTSPVPVQIWWEGCARSQFRCGRGEPAPSADVARVSPFPAPEWQVTSVPVQIRPGTHLGRSTRVPSRSIDAAGDADRAALAGGGAAAVAAGGGGGTRFCVEAAVGVTKCESGRSGGTWMTQSDAVRPRRSASAGARTRRYGLVFGFVERQRVPHA